MFYLQGDQLQFNNEIKHYPQIHKTEIKEKVPNILKQGIRCNTKFSLVIAGLGRTKEVQFVWETEVPGFWLL